jgi:hypothetical protein
MGIDSRLHVLGEVGIGHRRVAQFLFMRLRQCDALTDFPPWTLRRFDDGYGTMVLFHDHLDAFPNLSQHGVYIALVLFLKCGPSPSLDHSVSSAFRLYFPNRSPERTLIPRYNILLPE